MTCFIFSRSSMIGGKPSRSDLTRTPELLNSTISGANTSCTNVEKSARCNSTNCVRAKLRKSRSNDDSRAIPLFASTMLSRKSGGRSCVGKNSFSVAERTCRFHLADWQLREQKLRLQWPASSAGHGPVLFARHSASKDCRSYSLSWIKNLVVADSPSQQQQRGFLLRHRLHGCAVARITTGPSIRFICRYAGRN